MHRIILSVILIFIISCNTETSLDKQKTRNRTLALGTAAALYTPFSEVIPSAGEISMKSASGTVTRKYEPACTGTEGNKTFRFLVKKGNSKNLLVNFMGGGACWDSKNCLGDYTPTYFNKLDASPSYLIKFLFNGILDYSNASNPMNDWNMVFIPYCSGDLHWGSNSLTYKHPSTGASVSFKHKGFDNFLSVLKYIQTNSDFTPGAGNKILVIGQSAGGYGTIFNFSHIKEAFPNSETHAFADASNGVVPSGFQTQAMANWNVSVNLPSWVTGISDSFIQSGDLGEMIYKISQYYPASRFAQYTAEYDGNQRYFYNVMQVLPTKTYEDKKDFWGSSSGYNVPDSVTCDWRDKMRLKTAASSLSSNYKYYAAAGDVHTITTSKEFFSENSGGQTVRDWLSAFLENKSWISKDCRTAGAGCKPPATEASPSGVVCK